jgi:two-component system nitrogen regulation response regulator NtrX
MAAVAERSFREDLYYRLMVIDVHLPPLGERPQDVAPLVAHFVTRYAAANRKPVLKVGAEALALLQRYPWPGNVRQLENVIERAVVLADTGEAELTPSLLPASVREVPGMAKGDRGKAKGERGGRGGPEGTGREGGRHGGR